MTQNLYLGSSLDPALDPRVDTPAEFVAAVARIYGTALLTDFPTGPRSSRTPLPPSNRTSSACRR